MRAEIIKLNLSLLLIFIALACGGGGGDSAGSGVSSSTVTSSSSTKFFTVTYQENLVNNPTVTTAVSDSVTFDGLVGATTAGRNLLLGVRSSASNFTPELKLALEFFPSNSANLSGPYNAVIYGLSDTGQVSVAQYSLDFSSVIPSANTVLVSSNAAGLGAPGNGDALTTNTEGEIVWGDWKGVVSLNGNTLLMSKGKAFLLASKVPSVQNNLSGKSFTGALLFQFDQPNQSAGSGLGTISFSSSEMTSSLESSGLTTTSSTDFPNSGSRFYAQSGVGSSWITLYGSASFTLGATLSTEQGYVGSEEFLVVINPDNPLRPSLSIGIINE